MVDFVLPDSTEVLSRRRVARLGGEDLIAGEALATAFLDVALLDFTLGEVSSLFGEDILAESSEDGFELLLGEDNDAAGAAGFFLAPLVLFLTDSCTGDFTEGEATWVAFLVLLFGGDVMVGDLLGEGLTDTTSSADLPFLVRPLPLERTFDDSGCGDGTLGLVGVFV